MGRNTTDTAAQAGIETADLATTTDAAALTVSTPDRLLIEVRALVTDERLGIEAGRIGHVPEAELEALKLAGVVDDHPDAVAYARSLVD